MAPGKQTLITSYLAKMKDQDVDFRFMALSDLTNTAIEDPALFGSDDALEAKTVSEVLKLVEDKNSEVKNQAVKCIGQLIKSIRESQMNAVIDSLVEFIGGKDDELRDIAGLGLKTVTAELPQEGKLPEKACAKLAPKLLAQVEKLTTPPETVIEMLSILSILVSRFPVYLADVYPSPIVTLTPLLNHPRIAVRKRAVFALAQFLPTASEQTFEKLLKSTIQPALMPNVSLEHQRTIILLLGAIARFAPQQIGPVLSVVVLPVLSAASRDDVELREVCLQSLETLVLRCPSEITPFLSGISNVGIELIKYDPNYTGDDEDEEMQEADEDEDEDLGDDYSDDEETSYKVRRSATKLLSAVIGTRPELLATVYRTIAPVLISRFGDREESVRLEIWSAYSLLLQQTGVYGAAPQAQAEGHIGTKRKREEEGMEVEETPHTLLRSQVPNLSKALIKQLQAKTSATTIQTGFNLLHTLLSVNPGCLSGQIVSVTSVISTVLNKLPSSTSSTLHIAIISFLDLFFSTHSPAAFSQCLPQLTSPLVTSLSERDPRIAAAAFQAFSTLLKSLKPVRSADWADNLYVKALERLERNDTDVVVREKAEECVAELWLCATEIVRSKGGQEWVALRKSGRTGGAVKVIEKVVRGVDFSEEWVGESVQWVLGVIRKTGRLQKDEAFACLEALLGKYRAGFPAGLTSSLASQLLPYLSLADLSHFAHALSVITLLLRTAPQEAYPLIEATILPSIYSSAVSPSLTVNLLDALLDFFGSLVAADPPIASRLVLSLTLALDQVGSGPGSAANTSKCIAAVIRNEISLAAGTISDFAKAIKPASKASDARLVLSLHVLGEIGRFVDMSLQNEVFTNSLTLFSSDSQDIRSAAAFAVGNIAIGNISTFLPIIVKQVQADAERRLLSLHALKEVVTHCSSHQLEGVADALWTPLFENPENSEESTRNVAAACLGKLTTTNPSRYLPQLQARLHDASPAIRATVVSSVRYTFADTAEPYDELLSPLIVDFLSLVLDPDLTVRRLSLTSLNAAARNKPKLIKDHLSTLMPLLYAETALNDALIRVVDMGPWKHRVDDGLETRKTAFETMYTILDTCLSSIDLHQFFTHVLRGLADESDEIKVLSHMMLFRLSQVAPTTVSQRLDEVSPELEETVKGAQVTKDTVKQDLERAGELQRSALRAIAGLSKISSPTVSPRMERLVESIEKGPMAREFRELL